jgi:hypothetical protein
MNAGHSRKLSIDRREPFGLKPLGGGVDVERMRNQRALRAAKFLSKPGDGVQLFALFSTQGDAGRCLTPLPSLPHGAVS